jgi:hypothetical protein
MSERQKPALSFWQRVGRVVVFLVGTGLTVLGVLTVAGVVVWSDGAGEPVQNIFVRILLGVFYGICGLLTVGGAIFGFPEVPSNRGPRTQRSSGGIDFDID